MPIFAKFNGSLVVQRLRFCKITGFKRHGLTAVVMYRGFETVKAPEKKDSEKRVCHYFYVVI